jgi:predicted aminopeptidase
MRLDRIHEIQIRFARDVAPRLQTSDYGGFTKASLNNARLLLYKTYVQDLSDFDALFDLSHHNVAEFIENCRGLENTREPEMELKNLITKLREKK